MGLRDLINEYNITGTAEELGRAQRIFRHIDGFIFENGGMTPEQRDYLTGFNYLISRYMDGKVGPDSYENRAGIESIDFAKFLEDYETAVQDEVATSATPRDRKKYDGVERRALDNILKQTKAFNKPLTDIWADRIKSGASLKPYRNATSGDDRRAMESTVLMHNTMQKVVNERTWGWRLNPFNWYRMYKENQYLKDLSKVVDSMNQTEVGTILSNYSDPVLSNEKAESFENYYNEKTSKVTNANEHSLFSEDDIRMPLDLSQSFDVNEQKLSTSPKIDNNDVISKENQMTNN